MTVLPKRRVGKTKLEVTTLGLGGAPMLRFFRFGHTPGRMDVAPAAPSLEHPFTLDLRRK